MFPIVPRSKAHGVDFCGEDYLFYGYHYIIRSDAGVYMRSRNLNEGSNIEVFDLHYSCKGGDHYLANNGYFYIINGTKYRRVTNLNTDANAVAHPLHPNCQGGDHYLSMCGKFYIVYKDRGVYRRTTDMNKDSNAVEYPLHSSCNDGLYYWGCGQYAYVVRNGDWGPQYHTTSNMNNNSDNIDYSFAIDVVKFLPGGLATTHGRAFGTWKLLKCFENTSQITVDWSKQVSHQTGARRTKLSSIENNWNFTKSGSIGGVIPEILVKYQLSLNASYGGKSIDTTTESWDDVTTVTETVNVSVSPGEQICFWQYKVGLGGEDFLFCPEMKMTDCKVPPTETPLHSV
ncbi:Hypothetical predicted protein [Paramuricea clavata]|uniref:Uncharacterized protein n=1 Tax=Paramuricea clavata TaxID=317549 RepID=A0A7D9DB86_PARCT|nr:Hypothetical predicted protein [Paramuricea clavata]